jgi:acetyltransferase-like isoleucine patch superfamily enzyme
MTWPHQVCIGRYCQLEDDLYFKFDGIWQTGPSIVIRNNVFLGRGCEFNIRVGIVIESDCLIASGCKFIDHDHGIVLGTPMRHQQGLETAIHIEEDVWVGVNAVILKGVHIRRGAVIAGGAVVTKSVPENEIWAGVPARCIGVRPSGEKARYVSKAGSPASATSQVTT